MLSGFESTGWGRRRHSPVRDSHRAQPGRPRLHSTSRLTLETAGARATSRFGLLALDCATEHADIFPPLQPPGRAGLEPGTFHAWDGVDGRDWP